MVPIGSWTELCLLTDSTMAAFWIKSVKRAGLTGPANETFLANIITMFIMPPLLEEVPFPPHYAMAPPRSGGATPYPELALQLSFVR